MADPDIRNLSSIRNNGGARNALRTSLVKALVLLINLPFTQAFPVTRRLVKTDDGRQHGLETPEIEFGTEEYWLNMAISAVLVIAGGIFAGLTISLMSSDEVNLQVIEQTGTEKERKDARRVLRLLKRGKHWVLVTLLLSNVITNESLPIVLDRVLGGGWPAIVSSTVAIVIFGEVIPQSISVRYGLGVGAFFAPFVLSLMYLMYPIAYPTAKLLDYLLGEDHGTFYKRAGLKTLVTLHKTMGVERLNEDEVTIISAVLDLKEKPVGAIMTPMEDVFVMSSDRILDETTIEEILHTGFNRIPIHTPGEPRNFIGMLLVRILITYDPEDALPISSFPLATLPETGPDTSCLNILNYFQEGKSHMVIISESPGEPHGALGVLTLEDVIEELIGEEIIDESDVYIDVAKSIRRVQPGPLSKRTIVNNPSTQIGSPRASFALDPALAALANESDLSKLKLGPLNKASNPRMTGVRNVHIKPGNEPSTAGVGDETAKLLNSSANGVNINVHSTELGAVEEFFEQYSPRTAQTTGSKPLSPEEENSQSAANGELRADSAELHSYRDGGIIESIVNVDGVNKTVIEDVSGSDREAVSSSRWSASRHRSSSGSRHGGDDDAPTETRPLLDI